MLPYPTAFLSSRWEPYPERPRNVGDVFPPNPSYSRGGILTGFNHQHICGEAEDFAIGGAFDPAANVVRDSDWIPTCCGRDDMCVFNICAQPVLNDYPTSQLTTYPVPHQQATTTTPVYTQQLAVNGLDTTPPGATMQFTFQPGGSGDTNGYAHTITSDPLGGMYENSFTMRLSATNVSTQTQRWGSWSFTVESDEGTADMWLLFSEGAMVLTGTNLTIDPALLPPPPPPPPPGLQNWTAGGLVAAGTTRTDAAAITARITQAVALSTAAGIRLPAASPGQWVVTHVGTSPVASLNLYPASGEAFQGMATNAPLVVAKNTSVYLTGSAGFNGQWAYFVH